MQIKVSKFKRFILGVLLLFGMMGSAQAADISAIDYNGNLIGKVIPDGSVVDFNNELIGRITADGFAVNEENILIGGIVPQGIAISYNNSVLGKVNNDGSVTSATDDYLGRVLPDGLVVNDNYDILGAVVSPGLVYDDKGKIVGRVSGDGNLYNLSGEKNGYITASGYAFAPTGAEQKISLIGRLISSKMVITPSGKFLGSIAPDGKVSGINKNVVGNVRANGFIYNADGNAIGHIVETGYAFNYEGGYLGIVSYNGDVLDKGKVVGTAVVGNRVVGKDGTVLGFTIRQAATANTPDGKYLGRLIGNGNVVKAQEIIGKIGASGNVIDNKGQVIGYINATGPVFDYLGSVRGNAAVGGKAISLEGAELGYVQKQSVIDKKGREFARVLNDRVIYSSNNEFMGQAGINTPMTYNGKNYTITPYGYVFDEKKVISGLNYKPAGIVAENGNILTYVANDGKTENSSLNEVSQITGSGILIDKNNKLLGKTAISDYATDFYGTAIGYTNPSNLVINSQNQIDAKILPNGQVVSITGNPKQQKGTAGTAGLGVSINGDYLGAVLPNGRIRKAGEIIGKVSSDGYVLDNMGALYGLAQPFGTAITSDCKFLGVVSDNGDVKNGTGAHIGMILANKQVMNETEEVIGYVVQPQAVLGDNGNILGVETPVGTVLNYDNHNLGCQDIWGNIKNSQNEIVGQLIPQAQIMDYSGQIIGETNFSGNVINEAGQEIAYIGLDGSVYDSSRENIGVVFKYKVAFDDNNAYLGRVNSRGDVLSDSGDILGHVNYNGFVRLQNGKTGYALYDLYAYDNDGKTIGYIAKNGMVYSIMGEIRGAIYQGFVLDKKQNLIARGNRDYYIRNSEKNIIGYLNLDGSVINYKNIQVGQLGDNGKIIDSSNTVIAEAEPLQYYHRAGDVLEPPADEQSKEKDIPPVDAKNENPDIEINEQPADLDDNQTETDIGKSSDTMVKHKIVGIAVTPGGKYIGDVNSNDDVIDSSGKIVGSRDKNGKIIDGNGKVIGDFQAENKPKDKTADRNWWKTIMQGVVVPAHGTGNEPVNVGPAGGAGPGGRYDPRRAAILAQLQSSRRQSMSGKSISNNIDTAAYTGWQDSWNGVERSISTLRVDMSNMITADKPIPAVLARSLISLGNVPITAIVERNVYGEMGRNVIIPAGSRIIGGLNDGTDLDIESRFDGTSGGVKLKISWQRIIRPDGIAFILDSRSQTGDAQGRGGGALGYVDEQMVKKYTMPLVGTLATSAITYMMAADQDATGEVETSKQQAASDARQQFMEKMNDILDEIIENKSQIEPVTFVPAGTRIIIYPMTDLWLRSTKEIEKGETSIVDARHKNILIDDNETTSVETNNNTNQRVQNNQGAQNQPQNSPLIGDDNPQQNQQQRTSVPGAIPPPAADGTVADFPDDDEEMTGDIELF